MRSTLDASELVILLMSQVSQVRALTLFLRPPLVPRSLLRVSLPQRHGISTTTATRAGFLNCCALRGTMAVGEASHLLSSVGLEEEGLSEAAAPGSEIDEQSARRHVHRTGSVADAARADPLRPRPLLRQCLNDVPDEPGVYVMESVEGCKLYIGKSVKLSARVPSYFSYADGGGGVGGSAAAATSIVHPGSNLSRRIAVMTTLVESIDYIVTASGAEALMLEASMIRQHQPAFNVLLKDDKRNYPYVCFTWSESYPRLIVTKDRPRAGGGEQDRYYGPFVDPGQLRSTVALVRRVLPLRKRHRPLYKDKPCLNYDIGICPGACQKLISENVYTETVRLAEMVFRGQGGELLERLRQRMERASRAEEFEKAGEYKEQMALVRGGLLGSALHFSPGSGAIAAAAAAAAGGGGNGLSSEEDDDMVGVRGKARGKGKLKAAVAVVERRDVVAVGLAGNLACFQVFRVREGRLIGRLGFTYRVEERGLTRGEVLQACLERYWGDALASTFSSSSLSEGRSSQQSAEGSGILSSLSSSSPASPSLFLGYSGKKEGAAENRGEVFADIPDEVVTADALPEGGAELLSELLSEAKVTFNAKDSASAHVAAAAADKAKTDGAQQRKGRTKGDTGDSARTERCGGGKKLDSINEDASGEAIIRPLFLSLPAVVRIVHDEGTGERHHLCVMVSKNAELEARRLLKGSEGIAEGLEQLARMLGLSSPPARIEGFDVSHTAGGQAVASSVSFVDGKADKRGHRRYRIKTIDVKKGHSDDYASLKEVVTRRFFPPRAGAYTGNDADVDPADVDPADVDPADPIKQLPDLVLIDGGKGQLAAAVKGATIAAAKWRRVQGDHNGAEVIDSAKGSSDGNVGDESARVGRRDGRSVSYMIPVKGDTFTAQTAAAAGGQGAFKEVDPDLILLRETESDDDISNTAAAIASASAVAAPRPNGDSSSCSSPAPSTMVTPTTTMVDVGRGRKVAFVSLAKKEEEVFVPGDALPLAAAVEAGPDSPGVMILRQVRDEAHRFALGYHRKLRSKNLFRMPESEMRSESVAKSGKQDAAGGGRSSSDEGNSKKTGFEGISGLSRRSRDALVEAFGSIEQARIAGEAELRRVPGVGPTIAKRILA